MHNRNNHNLINDYLDELKNLRRFSPHTIKNYTIDLYELVKFIELSNETNARKHSDRNILKTRETTVRKCLAKLRAKGQSPTTLSRKISSWRSFFNWLLEKELVVVNPTVHVKPPKQKKRLPSTLSTDQVSVLLDSITTNKGELEIRDKAIFELLYSSGLRISELVGLNNSHLREILAGEVRVIGKRQKVRIVPVGNKAKESIKKWLVGRRNIVDKNKLSEIEQDSKALFINKDGGRLSARSVQIKLSHWAKKVNLPIGVHPHMLRHSFASHVLQSSSDLRAVQEMLGHSSLATTQIYTHLDYKYIAKAYDKAHPRARKQH